MTRKYLKNIYTIIVVFILLLAPINAKAAPSNNNYIKDSGIIVNKNYKNEISKNLSYGKNNLYNYGSESYNTLNEVQNSIQSHMYNRDIQFTINYTGNSESLESDLEEVLDNISESDNYLGLSYSRIQWNAEGYDRDVNITYKFDYLTTRAEEMYVDKEVSNILSNILTSGMNEDEKEKVIHDYIVKNVTYDRSLVKHSAYDALYNGTTVCQGYALLAYKMLKEAGIDVKIVTGDGNGGPHAWNLVKIRGEWYQLDCTWDDPVPDTGRVRYNYYNLTDYEMKKDHSWDVSKYPAANNTYVYSKPDNDKNFDNYRKWTPKSNVPFNKVWTISFKGGDVDKNSVNNDNVYIFDESVQNKTAVYTEVIKNKVMVNSKSSYEAGHTYCLVIEKSVLSVKGQNIPSPIVMKFSISSNGNLGIIDVNNFKAVK